MLVTLARAMNVPCAFPMFWGEKNSINIAGASERITYAKPGARVKKSIDIALNRWHFPDIQTRRIAPSSTSKIYSCFTNISCFAIKPI